MLFPRALKLGLAAAAGLVGLALTAPAEARTHVSVGLGFMIPLTPSYDDGYYGPYGPPPYHRYGYDYGPPPVAYGPPVVYGPPPAAYAPAGGPEYSAPYVAPNGQYCREYRTKAQIDGRLQDMWGTACQQPDGTWR